MEVYAARLAITVGIILAMLAPLVALGMVTTPMRRIAPVLLVATLFTLDFALDMTPRFVALPGVWANWNWQGKLLEMAWPLALIAVVPTFSFSRFGLQFSAALGAWRWTAILSAVYLGLFISYLLWANDLKWHSAADPATPVFQFTMPGLAEEFVFRGILQSLLNESFGRPWKFGAIHSGWGLPIVAVLFALGHGVWVDSHLHLKVSFGGMIFPLTIGLALGWLRERAGNVWPCIVLHTVIDGAAGLLG